MYAVHTEQVARVVQAERQAEARQWRLAAAHRTKRSPDRWRLWKQRTRAAEPMGVTIVASA